MINLKKLLITSTLFIFTSSIIFGCGETKQNTTQKNYDGRAFYEIFVRSFNDSNGDGVGDLKGVTEKLDYLKKLGVKGIWLMPINKSGSYHGYDIDDYYSINGQYGTMDDFKQLLKEAHKRDIKVIMDLVLNHTSVNNEWFKSARESKDSPYRNYYIWSNDMSLINKISPMNTKLWTKNEDKNELYYSIFWSGMPDLNYDNPKVVAEAKKIAKYYLDQGVDGFRVDAAKWIFDDQNKNPQFWSDFNKYIKSVNNNAILVGEVWDSPFNTIKYVNSMDSFFEFSTDKYIVDRINGKAISGFVNDYTTVSDMYKEDNSKFIMSPFLTNHDLNRVMDSLSSQYKMKMAAAMYLTLPGTPFIYYGEEIGEKGSGTDEQKRQPFTWSSTDASKNTSWEKVNYDTSKIAVDVEEKDKDSLLNFYKDILSVRNNYECLRYGSISSIDNEDTNMLTMVRSYKGQKAYVLINGNEQGGSIILPKGEYKVVYSNKDKKETLNSDGKINIKNEEIMIVIKE